MDTTQIYTRVSLRELLDTHRHTHPAETGAFARRRDDTLIGALAGCGAAARLPGQVLLRHVARLRELAALLAGTRPPALGLVPLPDRTGLGWVDTARGLLVHLVQLRQGRLHRCRILAPTEWNAHPQGALVQALRDGTAADPAEWRERASRLIQCLDPCVACHIEVEHA